jgi:SAM-dependent methyltransferase
MFADNSFDFVYSYIVFQHIPNRDVVLNYLSEARRVLKPGGILRCQLRGTPPLDSEMEGAPTTWTGCHVSGEEVTAFARRPPTATSSPLRPSNPIHVGNVAKAAIWIART